jgi:membrane-associated phospholipid phosphatase
MTRSRLMVVGVVSLLVTALLSLIVSRGFGAIRLEWRVLEYLPRHPSASWGDLAGFLAVPAIGAVLIASVAFGALKRVLVRVIVGAGSAALAFVITEHVMKPLVGQTWNGPLLSFPSGHVTAVCATALAMWIALYPVLGTWTRVITFALAATWTCLMSAAVVGALWHTPLDAIGSVVLSVGVVAAVAAILDPKAPARRIKRHSLRVTAGI